MVSKCLINLNNFFNKKLLSISIPKMSTGAFTLTNLIGQTQQQFSIHNAGFAGPTLQSVQTAQHISQAVPPNLSTGNSGTSMTIPQFFQGSLVVAPGSGGATYILPSAADILTMLGNLGNQQYGFPQPIASIGSTLPFVVCNRGAGPATIQGVTGAGKNASSTDFQSVTVSSGANGTIQATRLVTLEWNQLSSDGKTGSFLLY